jgi:hypothetical protein
LNTSEAFDYAQEAASETEWGIALEREAVIRPLAEQARLSTAAIEDAVARLRLSRSVLYVRRFAERQLPSPHYRTIQGALRDWICAWSSQSAKDRNVRGIYAAPSAFSLFAPISPWTSSRLITR